MNKELKFLLNEFVFVVLYIWTVILLFFTADSLASWQTQFLVAQNAVSSSSIFLFLLWIFFAILPLLNTGIIGNPSFVLHGVFTGEANVQQTVAVGVADFFAYALALFILPASYTHAPFPLPVVSATTSQFEGVLIEAAITFGMVFSCAYVQRFVNVAPSVTASTAILTSLVIGAPSTGAFMNPSSATAICLSHGNCSQVWIYWVGPLLGALISGLLFRYLFPGVRSFTSSDQSADDKPRKNRQSSSSSSFEAPSSSSSSSSFWNGNQNNNNNAIDNAQPTGTILQPLGQDVQRQRKKELRRRSNNNNNNQNNNNGNVEEQRRRLRERQQQEEEEKEKKSREEKKAAKKKLKALKESTRKTHSQFTKSSTPSPSTRRIAPVMQPSRRG